MRVSIYAVARKNYIEYRFPRSWLWPWKAKDSPPIAKANITARINFNVNWRGRLDWVGYWQSDRLWETDCWTGTIRSVARPAGFDTWHRRPRPITGLTHVGGINLESETSIFLRSSTRNKHSFMFARKEIILRWGITFFRWIIVSELFWNSICNRESCC